MAWVAQETSGLLSETSFAEAAEGVALVIEIVGISVLVVGSLLTAWQAAGNALNRRPVYEQARRSFGRGLLLCLEVLVAADVVQTVAVDLTLESVATLGLLVLVRTVLSFSLSAELEGVLPWRRAQFEVEAAQREAAQQEAGRAATRPPSTAPRGEQ